MRPIEVEAPEAFAAKARWVIQSFLDASAPDPSDVPVRYPSSGLRGSEAALAWAEGDSRREPVPARDGLVDFGDGVADVVASAFWHLSRWEEREGSPRDRHGRFAAEYSAADPERPAVDALLRLFHQATGLAPRTGFTVALTHDIDAPWRWSSPFALRAAAARAKAAVREGRAGDALVEAVGLATAPIHRLRGTDPNWTFERMHEIERRHGGRSTHFLLAGHAHPNDGPDARAYDRLRGRIARVVAEGGDEIGLHASYTASDDLNRLSAEKHRLEELTGGAIASLRFHFLRHDTHRTLPQMSRLGFRLDSSQGYADRPGLRAGFSHPYRPFDLAADRALELVELPLAVMDATLQDARYLGLSPAAGLARATSVLEHVAASGGAVAVLWHNDRFSRTYGRGWDRVYDDLLGWIRDRGGRLCAAEDVLAERF